MPEGVEIEIYRRLAGRALGRRITAVEAPDAWYLKGGLTAEALGPVLIGRRFTEARRIGKLLLLDTDGEGPTLGLRFGMTGRLTVDGEAGIDRLEYSSRRDEPAWERVSFVFESGRMAVRDPRRLGGVFLDVDESRLGADAFGVGLAGLRDVMSRSGAPVKARLMDQSRLAGVGNLIADEVLWRSGIDPARPAGSLAPPEVRRLHRHLRTTLDDLMIRGGSHTGDLFTSRVRGGSCPRDGAPLQRRTVAGRTTWSCPLHQR